MGRLIIPCLIAALLSGTAASQTKDRESTLLERIKLADATSERLSKEALALGHWGALGTMWNEVDAPEHRCTVLGILLGKDAYTGRIKPLISEPLERKGLEAADVAESLQVRALSYLNRPGNPGGHLVLVTQR